VASKPPGRTPVNPMAIVPSVDRLLRTPIVETLIERAGRPLVTEVARGVVDQYRRSLRAAEEAVPESPEAAVLELGCRIEHGVNALVAPSLRPVFNLTGTVLHTNLGRAPLPAEAIDAMVAVSSKPSNLEYDLKRGGRGDRDDHVEAWLKRLTGAEAATIVNNNAAAVLLTLNTLAEGREIPVSRGQLVEIGGAFRIPDIMTRAGCRLVEVGTTNRTHLRDYEQAIGEDTAALMTVHTSNYLVMGFTASVDDASLAGLARARGVPYINDLGSGTLIDLQPYGLPREPTVREVIENGADVVTFSGDKLLGGPQCGIIVGRADLIDAIKHNPMKRALRLDKVTIAALEAVLRLYADPGRLRQRLPALALLTRERDEIDRSAERVAGALRELVSEPVTVTVEQCRSQIGSGALPVDLLPSCAVVLRLSVEQRRRTGPWLEALARAFRALPTPVIGRIRDDGFALDLRCLDDEPEFLAQLPALDLPTP